MSDIAAEDNSKTIEPEEIVKLSEGLEPMLVFPRTYAFFLSHGTEGQDALLLYLHLQWTAKLQKTTSVWANDSYLKQGLHFGIGKLKAAKAFLARHNLIEYNYRKDDKGRVERVYIIVKAVSASTRSKTVPQEKSTGTEILPIGRGDKCFIQEGKCSVSSTAQDADVRSDPLKGSEPDDGYTGSRYSAPTRTRGETRPLKRICPKCGERMVRDGPDIADEYRCDACRTFWACERDGTLRQILLEPIGSAKGGKIIELPKAVAS